MWVTAGGAPCEMCAMAAGQIVAMDEMFNNGLIGPEDSHPNCLCEISPIMKEGEISIENVWTGGVI